MTKLATPRFENAGPIHAIGISAHYSRAGDAGIMAQWQKLGAMMPQLPPQQQPVAYGICFDRERGFDYFAGIDVAPDATAGNGASKVSLPACRYAVFAHAGHVSGIADACAAIFRDWAPRSGRELAREKDGTHVFFERYGPAFDYRSGSGDIELWIPVK